MADSNLNSYLFSGSILSSYLVFYTAYDKKKKKLDIELVKDFFLLRRGLDWSAVELNKAASLAGLTCVLSSYITPYMSNNNISSIININMSKETNKQVFNHGVSMCVIHSIYSFGKFYQFSLQKIITDKNIKKISIILGEIAQFTLLSSYFINFTNYLPNIITNNNTNNDNNDVILQLSIATTPLMLAHFWTMEVDYKYQLQVRPFAYLPFLLGGVAVVLPWFTSK